MIDEIKIINNKYNNLIKSDFKSFDNVSSLKKVIGVYMIFNDSEKLLYVGNTNNFHVRFGTDLKHETTHTFVRKLIKTGKCTDRHDVVDFLKNKCKFKVEVCSDKLEAEALEHITIYIHKPEFNNYGRMY